MSTARPAKHDRAASTVSRSPKRAKEQYQDANEEARAMKSKSAGKGKKRDNVEVEGSTEAGSQTEGDTDDDAKYKDADTTQQEAPTKKSKKKTKLPRLEGKDSPLNLNEKNKKKRQDDLTSAGSFKGKGKRRLDDSDDHEIGDEWTDLNGLRWRMGDDGERRREAVVLEMRPKYPNMPKDSRHPDAKLQVEVLVEKFLTEKEYVDAKAKKLLSFQEMDRQKELDEVEAIRMQKLKDEEETRRRRTAQEGGREITTPKKVRDLQALFHSATKSASPARNTLPFSISQSRSGSLQYRSPSTPASSSVKRLSLSLGSEEKATSSIPTSITPPSIIKTPLPPKVSYRLPLASPSSPGTNTISVNGIRHSPIIDAKAKRKREEMLLKLLQEEADRRKQREMVK